VIHYCMGGLEIDVNSNVIATAGKPIPGLYAAGEVAGGVHGNNRLGGNSLLDCVVFGRVAGKHCARYMLGDAMKDTSLYELSGGGLTGAVSGSKLSGGSYEDGMNQSKSGGAPAAGGGGGGAPAAAKPGLSMEEIAKHNKKGDCWVILNDTVLNVSDFLKDHPGGELAILTFAGRDATEEFNMIHPPDVIDKYLDPACKLGPVGGAADAAGAAGGDMTADAGAKADVMNTAGDEIANLQAFGKWREVLDDNPGVFVINIWSYFKALWYVIVALVLELVRTIFSVNNFKFNNDRSGVTRSAIFLIVFQVIHAIGNLHVFLGPDDFNGYGYFYVRLYFTGFGLNANIVEEYLLLAAMLHVLVALKRTWDINLQYTVSSGKLNMAITGVLLLTFMTIHLFQFRFGETQPYLVRPPPYFINLWPGIMTLSLFWVKDPTVEPVPVRDIYELEWRVFSDPVNVAFYLFSVVMFMTHAMLGWQKVVPAAALGIPKKLHTRVNHIGWALIGVIGLMYISFPVYTSTCAMKPGSLGQS